MSRVAVEVRCFIDTEGIISPEWVRWSDGRVWQIERVLHTCESPDQSFEGVRYTVLIGGQEKYIYHTKRGWYVFASQEGEKL